MLLLILGCGLVGASLIAIWTRATVLSTDRYVTGTITGGLAQSIFDLPMAVFALVVIGIVALPVLPVVVLFLGIMSFLAWWWADEVRSGRVEEVQRGRGLEREVRGADQDLARYVDALRAEARSA